jgi:hypothetical protein
MTTVSVPSSIKQLSQRLKQIDSTLGREIKNYLPYWWDDELASSPGATQQALISIAKFASLDIKSVLNTHEPLRFKDSIRCYKHANNKEKHDLAAATAIVQSLANTVADITLNEYRIFQEAQSIRNNFLNQDKPWIDFKSLVDYCWKHGVPVLYLPELPVSKKMDAVVVDVNGRPVISLTKKHKHESALLFLLAHEMGHIFHRHLERGQTLVDMGVIDPDERDEQEKQANTFAIELLTGSKNGKFHSNGIRLTADRLAHLAKEKSSEMNVDPGHIALNWGHTTENHGSANAALNILYPAPDWKNYIKSNLLENIDEEEANEDQLDYLYKLMNIEE